MICPKCGSHRCKYIESRRKKWKGRAGDSSRSGSTESRTDFNVKCSKCGFKGKIK